MMRSGSYDELQTGFEHIVKDYVRPNIFKQMRSGLVNCERILREWCCKIEQAATCTEEKSPLKQARGKRIQRHLRACVVSQKQGASISNQRLACEKGSRFEFASTPKSDKTTRRKTFQFTSSSRRSFIWRSRQLCSSGGRRSNLYLLRGGESETVAESPDHRPAPLSAA